MKTALIRRHFPDSKTTWKKYLGVLLPILLAQTIVALNGMVDNFMVGHIEQGQSALAAVNSWTNIFVGLLMATSAAGSIGLAQFYHAKKYDVVKNIVRLRFTINITGAIVITLMSLIWPNFMIGVFLKSPSSNDYEAIRAYQKALENAKAFLEIIVVQWLLMAISFEIGNQLREIGHAKVGLITSSAMLIFNIVFNSIFLYGLKMGVQGAAIATSTSRLVNLIFLPIYIHKKQLAIGVTPWSFFRFKSKEIKGKFKIYYFSFNITRQALALVFKRYIYFISVFTVMFFITFRNFFYDAGYLTNSLGVGVGGIAVLGLTGAIMNIFTTTFGALPAMAANFVGSELGKNNFEAARKNSDSIKGFNTLVAFVMAVLLAIFALIIPYLSFFSYDKFDQNNVLVFDAKSHLEQVQTSTLVIAFWFPVWIWFVSSYRNSQTGGKGKFMPIWDWIISGPIQLGWLALIMYVIVPSSAYISANFWVAYMIFFISDLFKLVGFEFYYYKYKWLNSLTQSEVKVQKSLSEELKPEDYQQSDSAEV